jgi:hypothetical protein
MFDEVISATGRYEYLIEVERLKPVLLGRWQYVASLVSVTDRITRTPLANTPSIGEVYGAWPDDSVADVAKEADQTLGEIHLDVTAAERSHLSRR